MKGERELLKALLGDLPTISKDDIRVQAEIFARTLRAYADAVEMAGIGSEASAEAMRSYSIAAELYAPTLIMAALRAE